MSGDIGTTNSEHDGTIGAEVPPYSARFWYWFWRFGYVLCLVFVFLNALHLYERRDPLAWAVFGTMGQVLIAVGLTAAIARGSTRVPTEVGYRHIIWQGPLVLLALSLAEHLIYLRWGW